MHDVMRMLRCHVYNALNSVYWLTSHIQDMNLAELGEAFRQARIDANLTQHDVAERSGVPRQRISAFETGKLPELGAVKMLSLFDAVGLELLARRSGHVRTLDDVLLEPAEPDTRPARQRVRLSAEERVRRTKGQ
jgi:transcriptional regulator with XRE-family HTH domain